MSDSAWSLPRNLQAGRPPCSCTWTTSPTLPAFAYWIVLPATASKHSGGAKQSGTTTAVATAGGESDACARSIHTCAFVRDTCKRTARIRAPSKLTGLESTGHGMGNMPDCQSRERFSRETYLTPQVSYEAPTQPPVHPWLALNHSPHSRNPNFGCLHTLRPPN